MATVNFLYNPERKGKTQLIEEFVVRQNIFDLIMEDLRTSPMKTPEQHYLLVGQRGTGKTTLLHRIRYAIEDSDKMRDWLIPIVLNEEQYNISELANLWENVGQLLEDYHGFTGLYEEMETKTSEANFDERCWEVLETALDKKGKKIVLLIDNIGDLLKKLSDLEVKRLRMILQTKQHLRLIAASPLYLESVLDYKQPLFEFFKVLRLESLDSDETRKLLMKLAEIHHEQEKIERILIETPERIETLRTLTGGVPRTIALMFNIFVEYEQENSLKDLERILDVVTPLYKHRMDDLPPQQQKIVDAMAKAWDPIGVKSLRERVRLEGKVISAQLRQLERNQVVQKMETNTKNHEYILRERFFNIWYLMRYGRKDDKQRVIWLMRFLENWCTDEEMDKRIAGFVTKLKANVLAKDYVDFFGELYSSMTKLTLTSKVMLKENMPRRYVQNIQLNEKEIIETVNESFAKGEFQEGLARLSMMGKLTEERMLPIVQATFKSVANNAGKLRLIGNALQNHIGKIQERLAQLAQQIKQFTELKDNEKTIEELQDECDLLHLQIRQFAIVGLVFGFAGILLTVKMRDFDSAISMLNSSLIIEYAVLKHEVYHFANKGGMRLVLLGVRNLYLNGQINALRKIFAENSFQGGINTSIPYSEIFNPIYLAINSIDKQEVVYNLAPEKAGIVKEIRDFILGNDKN